MSQNCPKSLFFLFLVPNVMGVRNDDVGWRSTPQRSRPTLCATLYTFSESWPLYLPDMVWPLDGILHRGDICEVTWTYKMVRKVKCLHLVPKRSGS